ncbi:hypothetical protein AGLY_013192 [Aphis glycines]|uniref:Uncharacterized protein n=1 Tax=Aphis glycines TaxID=307491 RepID=A0A6G0T5M1_APHGL|nr:hypothetical protein AGLY_013192 [Aphis glycines]
MLCSKRSASGETMSRDTIANVLLSRNHIIEQSGDWCDMGIPRKCLSTTKRNFEFMYSEKYSALELKIKNDKMLLIIGKRSSSFIIIVSQTYGESCIKFSTFSYLYKNFYKFYVQNNFQFEITNPRSRLSLYVDKLLIKFIAKNLPVKYLVEISHVNMFQCKDEPPSVGGPIRADLI